MNSIYMIFAGCSRGRLFFRRGRRTTTTQPPCFAFAAEKEKLSAS